MKIRCLVKEGDKWAKQSPADVSAWLWANEDKDAVAIDDATRPKVFYCSTEALQGEYGAKGKVALMFVDLARKLAEGEPIPDHTLSPSWCAPEGKLCSERGECERQGGCDVG